MRSLRAGSLVIAARMAAVSALHSAPAPSPRLRWLVPAYFYPGGPELKEWNALIGGGADVPLVAIAAVKAMNEAGAQTDGHLGK